MTDRSIRSNFEDVQIDIQSFMWMTYVLHKAATLPFKGPIQLKIFD